MHIWKLPQKDLIWKKKTDTSLNLDYNSFGISGYGAGIDLGASYQVMKNLTVSDRHS